MDGRPDRIGSKAGEALCRGPAFLLNISLRSGGNVRRTEKGQTVGTRKYSKTTRTATCFELSLGLRLLGLPGDQVLQWAQEEPIYRPIMTPQKGPPQKKSADRDPSPAGMKKDHQSKPYYREIQSFAKEYHSFSVDLAGTGRVGASTYVHLEI